MRKVKRLYVDSLYDIKKKYNNNILVEIEQAKLLIAGNVEVKDNVRWIRFLKDKLWK
jgi:hypothetical protein